VSGVPSLQDPLWLAAFAVVPWLVWRHHRRHGLGALRYSRLPDNGRRGRWRLHLPFYSRLLALALLVLALARPQLGYAWEESLTEGIDIEIVLDVSGSMGAEDFQPRNRLGVAKEVVKEFVAQRPADRIGVVIFSGSAVTKAALTTDRQMLAELIDSVELNTLPDGTAIGVALANAAARLKDSDAKTKVVILVTDGVNNAGAIDPVSAASVCKGLGIRVYTVGVGTAGRVPIPVLSTDPITGRQVTRRVLMNVEVDEELLRNIADHTGGVFYTATDSERFREVFDEIDGLEKTVLQTKHYVRYREVFQPFAWAALSLLLLPLAAVALGWTAEP
jgi:Ca-activated chloride channel family protein